MENEEKENISSDTGIGRDLKPESAPAAETAIGAEKPSGAADGRGNNIDPEKEKGDSFSENDAKDVRAKLQEVAVAASPKTEEHSNAIRHEDDIASAQDDAVKPAEKSFHLPTFAPEEEISLGHDFPALKESMAAKSAPTGGKKKIIIATVILFALAATAFAVYEYYQKPEEQPVAVVTQEDPRNAIVRSSLEAMRSVKTYDYDGNMNFSYKTKKSGLITDSEESETADTVVALSGVADYATWGSPSFYSQMTLDRSTSSSVAGSETSKSSMKLKTELVYLDGVLYFKPDSAQIEVPMSDTMGTYIKNYWQLVKHQWCFVPKENSASIIKGAVQDMLPLEVDPSSGNIAKIGGIIGGRNLLKFSKDLGDDKVGDADTYHYQVRMDDAQGYDLAVELIEAGLKAQAGEDEAKALREDLKGQTDKEVRIKEFKDLILDGTFIEIWIGKSDSLIRRIKIDGNFDEAAMESLRSKYETIRDGDIQEDDAQAAKKVLSFSLDYVLSDFNAVTVRKPEGAKNAYKIGGVIQYQAMNGAAAGKPDADGDGLSDNLEAIFGSDAKKADTDGDGYKDGDEVKAGYDPKIAGGARLDYDKISDSLK